MPKEILSPLHIREVFSRAKCLCDGSEVQVALNKMAQAIYQDLHEENPIVLCVLIGGVVLTGKLLMLLDFPLQVDYIHASRYGEKTVGGQLEWVSKPRLSFHNRTILIVDDILDHGATLTAIQDFCYQQGAKVVKSAVLVEKIVPRESSFIQSAHYSGIKAHDDYLFGYGMDYRGYLRNAPGIYALAKEDE